MPAISFSHVNFSYTSAPLPESINLTVCGDERVYIVDLNGSGKSTLLRLATSELSPDQGTVDIPEQPGPQAVDSEETIATSIEGYLDAVYAETLDALDRFERIGEAIAYVGAETSSLAEEYDSLLTRLESLDTWNLSVRRAEALAGLGLGRVDTDRLVFFLSQSQRGRLEIAALLLSVGQAPMLNGPTNHLDAGSSDYLSEMMVSWPGPVLLSSHGCAFIDEVAVAIVDLDTAPWQALATASGGNGPIGAYRCMGRYSNYLMEEVYARSPHRSPHQRQQEQQRGLVRHRRDSEIVGHSRAAPRAETRITRKFYTGRAQYVSTRRQAQGDHRLEAFTSTEVRRPRFYDLQLGLSGPAPRTGMAASTQSATVPGRLAPIAVSVMVGEHLPVTGANGNGKSALLAWMGRRSMPMEDSVGDLVVSGSALRIPQHLPRLGDPGMGESVWTEGIGDLGQGALHPRLWNRPVSELSDGNQHRVQLALAAAVGPKVLVVDEPTNYLDLDALEVLEAALRTWTGTLIVASHDR